MREAKIVVDMLQGELLPHAVLTLAERADPSPDRGDMLAEAQVDALNEGGVGVLSTSNRKPPLRSVSPATGVRPSAHSAVFPA